MPNDQRKVYLAEQRACGPEGGKKEVGRFLDWLIRRRFPRSRFPTVHLYFGADNNTFGYSRGWNCRICLGRWVMRSSSWRVVLAHELAHVVAQFRRDGRTRHGRPWRREFLRLVRLFDRDHARRLGQEFRRLGL